jgi:hypothetical protein
MPFMSNTDASTISNEERIEAVRSIAVLALQAGGYDNKSWSAAEKQICDKYGITKRQLGAWKRLETKALAEAKPELRWTLSNGNDLVYSAETDSRIVEAIDGKLFTDTEESAVALASELRAWGVTAARALGFAVVFWG